MIIVTGGAGLIGSNIVAGLNARGISDILVVDHLKNGHKVFNLADLNIKDYLDRNDFMQRLQDGFNFGKVEAVFHLGASSATTEWDGQFIMRNNYEYSKVLLHWCQEHKVQYFYASSASVYGLGEHGFRCAVVKNLLICMLIHFSLISMFAVSGTICRVRSWVSLFQCLRSAAKGSIVYTFSFQ